MTEKQFQKTVEQALLLHGWKLYHTHDSRRSHPGFPDLVAAHPDHGIIFVELKTTRGRLTQPQKEWLAALAPHASTHVWRPTDWPAIIATAKGEPL